MKTNYFENLGVNYLTLEKVNEFAKTVYSLIEDPSHNLIHAIDVTIGSFRIAALYNSEEELNYNVLYTAAMLHDIGLILGRKIHHIDSATIFRNSSIYKFFDEEECLLIIEAIEDHRASMQDDPRSIYGKIISQADRGYSSYHTICRSYKHTKFNHPDCSESKLWEIVHKHLIDKFGEQGTAWKKYFIVDQHFEFFKKYMIYLTKLPDKLFSEVCQKVKPTPLYLTNQILIKQFLDEYFYMTEEEIDNIISISE